jgi:hypothetical protein
MGHYFIVIRGPKSYAWTSAVQHHLDEISRCVAVAMNSAIGRRRALELLAGAELGCTEAIMLAHGFKMELLVELMRDGLAAAAQRVYPRKPPPPAGISAVGRNLPPALQNTERISPEVARQSRFD